MKYSHTFNKFKLIKESVEDDDCCDEETLDEESTTASVDGFETPAAFGKVKKKTAEVLGFRKAKQEKRNTVKNESKFMKMARSLYLEDSSTKINDYSNSKYKILVGRKTNLLKNMKERYETKSSDNGDIHYIDKGHHFATLEDHAGHLVMMHDGSLNDYGYRNKS